METLIAGITITKFGYFMAWAFLGQIAMVVIQVKKYISQINSEGGFQIAFWWKDNRLRILISFLTALILSPIAVLTIVSMPGVVDEMAAMMAGAFIDKTVESFTNKKK